MASRRARAHRGIDVWPGYVDALATLLLSVVFLLTVFVVGQFFLSQELTGRDAVLTRLNRQIADLTDLLALERSNRRAQEEAVAGMRNTLTATEAERDRLQALADAATATQGKSADGDAQLAAALEDALSASESRDRESQARIAELGSRLNVALAQRVQELARYRSDFFGRLRQIIGARSDIRIVGDRFVLQSEVLFAAGSAALKPEAGPEIDRIAGAILDISKEIPADIPWVLRVDGHTDARPIQSPQFPSNWALSAARAIAVVQYLRSKGIPPQRLLAGAFGEFQPLDSGTSEEAYSRNRRIEMKLTER
jgi:chemotaxis protein MotB